MLNRTWTLLAVGLLGLTGCPIGTPSGHSRPHGHQDVTIDISPADDALVLNATGQGGRDLYILNFADKTVRRIAETPDYEVAPTFSPDGKTIAYAAGLPGDNADHIFTIGIDGQAKTQLTTQKANDTSPSYSPDGTMITFVRDKSYTWGGLAANWEDRGVICVINSDGTNERQLTQDNVFAFSPQFSPDGTHVLYWTTSGLFSVSVTENTPAKLLGPLQKDATISSNGQAVVFSDGKYSPDREIFMSQLDGTQKTQITNSPNGCYHPVQSHSGEIVFFLMEEWPSGSSGHPKSSIWSVSSRGENQKQISDRSLFDAPAQWNARHSR